MPLLLSFVIRVWNFGDLTKLVATTDEELRGDVGRFTA
jgi:hypothetical protein